MRDKKILLEAIDDTLLFIAKEQIRIKRREIMKKIGWIVYFIIMGFFISLVVMNI